MKKNKKIGSCKLCKENKELINSHIIPELFYRYLYDSSSRALEISNTPFKVIPFQKGHREYMLCSDCDQRIGRLEKYIADLWRNDFPKTITENIVTIYGVDYKKFKLFHLSILWRASLSNLHMFRHVKLGPHEEKIRTMLLNDDPGQPDQYSFLPSIQYMEENIIHTIVEPVSSKKDGFTFYKFYFGGVVWHYIISSHSCQNFTGRDYPFFSNDGILRFSIQNVLGNSDLIGFADIANSKERRMT